MARKSVDSSDHICRSSKSVLYAWYLASVASGLQLGYLTSLAAYIFSLGWSAQACEHGSEPPK